MRTAPTYLHLQSNCKYITQPFSSSYIRGTRCRKSESMVLCQARTGHRWRGRLCRHLHWRLGLWCLRWSSSLACSFVTVGFNHEITTITSASIITIAITIPSNSRSTPLSTKDNNKNNKNRNNNQAFNLDLSKVLLQVQNANKSFSLPVPL